MYYLQAGLLILFELGLALFFATRMDNAVYRGRQAISRIPEDHDIEWLVNAYRSVFAIEFFINACIFGFLLRLVYYTIAQVINGQPL